MFHNKINTLLLLVLLFCYFEKAYSAGEKEDEKVKTIYVTVTGNSTNQEEATSTIEELVPTKTVEVESLPEYIKFEEALEQSEDECMRSIYVVSLNLFYANQINTEGCDNGHFNALKSYRKAKPCKDTKYQLAVDYMDANFRLLCHTRSTGTYTYEGKMGKELCPILNVMKTNMTKYEELLFKDCNTNDTCVYDILSSYKEIKRIRKDLSEVTSNIEEITYKRNENETVVFKMNITDSFFERVETNCPIFKTISESNALHVSISISTVLIFSLFMIYMFRM